MCVIAMTKNFQELNLTAANLTDSLVSDPGYIVVSGAFDSGSVTISLTEDTSATPITIPVQAPTAFLNPVTGANAFPVQAHRLTFTIAGGAGSEAVNVKWYPVHIPF